MCYVILKTYSQTLFSDEHEELEENGVGGPLSFDQLAQLFDLDHFGIIQISSSNVSLPKLGKMRRVSFEDLEHAFEKMEKQFSVYNFMSDTSEIEGVRFDEKDSSRNFTEVDAIQVTESAADEWDDDYYDYDYVVPNSTFKKYLYRNVSEKHLDIDSEATDIPIEELNYEHKINETTFIKAQLEKNDLSFEKNVESFTPKEISLTTTQSYDHSDLRTQSNSENEPDSTSKTSYNLFGREYEFYDQLIKEKTEQTTYGSAYEFLSKINNKVAFDSQTDTNIGNEVTEENSLKNTSNVHLILVTTETPELKNWKRQILQEKIKLLRLKQQLIQHQVRIVRLNPKTLILKSHKLELWKKILI